MLNLKSTSLQRTLLKSFVLLLACLLLFGRYYIYDLPSAINTPLKKWMGTEWYTEKHFAQLYSAYTLPNLVMPILGGLLIDRFGTTKMLTVFSVLIVVGQSIFTSGVFERNHPMMVAGRLVTGIGGESLDVAQSSIISDWFAGPGLSAAFSVLLSSGRISTAINDNLSPYVAEKTDVAFASVLGTWACILSCCAIGALMIVDRPSIRAICGLMKPGVDYTRDETEVLLSPNDTTTPPLSYTHDNYDHQDRTSLLLTQDSDDGNISESETITENSVETSVFSMSQFKGLSTNFWILCGITFTLCGSTLPFLSVCTPFLEETYYNNDLAAAAFAMSLPTIISAICTPISGMLIDIVGRKVIFLPISASMMMSTYVLFFCGFSPTVCMTLLGLSYSIFPAALWPLVPEFVDISRLGTGYGLMCVGDNLSRFVLPFVVAYVRIAYPTTFTPMLYTFGFISFLGIVLSSLLLYRVKKSH